jgi:deoxycytidylate deaminase
MKQINYPYKPEDREYLYTDMKNEFMQEAMNAAHTEEKHHFTATGCALVRDGKVISTGSNLEYHLEHGCERIRQNMPPGVGYELCEGCTYSNHAEATAIRHASETGVDVSGSDAYIWGHWWACKPCWDNMIKAGIKDVYLLEGSEIYFDRNNPENHVKDFEFFQELIRD